MILNLSWLPLLALRAQMSQIFCDECSHKQGRRNEGRAKGGNADGKGNFGLMNYIYKVVDVNPQISKPRNSYNAEIKNLYAVATILLQIVDNKWFTMLR